MTTLNDDIYSTFPTGVSADGRTIFVFTDRFSEVTGEEVASKPPR
jgi:hypothetical protein